jgi:hypothetical protein
MLIAELPDYLTSLGGEDYKGLLLVYLRSPQVFPTFSGRLTDRIDENRYGVWRWFVVCGFLSVGYHSLSFLITFLLSSWILNGFQNPLNGGLHC